MIFKIYTASTMSSWGIGSMIKNLRDAGFLVHVTGKYIGRKNYTSFDGETKSYIEDTRQICVTIENLEDLHNIYKMFGHDLVVDFREDNPEYADYDPQDR